MKLIKLLFFVSCIATLNNCGIDENAARNKGVDHPNCSKLENFGALYLGGEDGGAWFLISRESCLDSNSFRIREFHETTCELAWDGIFTLKSDGFDISKPYTFVPLSSYEYCSIEQNGVVFKLEFKKRFEGCNQRS